MGRPPRAGLGPRSGPAAVAPAGSLERVLSTALHELRMDSALLSEIRDEHEVVVSEVGNGRITLFGAGTAVPLQDTICRLLLEGAIDGVVPDATRDAVLRKMAVVRETGLRAYIGVPVKVGGVRQFVMCCLSLEERPDLGDADARFLRGVAERLRSALDDRAAAQ